MTLGFSYNLSSRWGFRDEVITIIFKRCLLQLENSDGDLEKNDSFIFKNISERGYETDEYEEELFAHFYLIL